MKEGIFYPHNVHIDKKIRKYSVLLFGLLMFGSVAMAHPLPDNPPSFVNGNSQTFTVCENSSATDISSLMTISDADAGQTETWTIVSGALHGGLGGFPFSATSTGANVTPAGLTYTPDTGYSGNDTFTVQVSDGIDSATTTVILTVTPLPTLSSSLTPPAICDGSVFSYVPTSTATEPAFTWSRLFTGGISNPADTGSGNPFETLVNISYDPIPVTYTYTLTAVGCTNIQSIVVVVKPTPRLSSDSIATICSGGTFSYVPTSKTTGTTYTWSRAAVTGISPDTSTGSGNINEALTNSLSTPVNTGYLITLTAYGCTHSEDVILTVNPQDIITTITTEPSSSPCSGTLFQNFGAGIAPPAGVTYSWSAVNANIYAVGSSSQYSLVNFPNGGNAFVILTTTVAATGCITVDSYAVNVSAVGVVANGVIYFNDQFVYLSNQMDSYQWGYDDASTLDSTLIDGATFQSYPNSLPDFIDNDYWVITTKGGCSQKTYYNQPLPMGVTNVSVGANVSLKVYPNPSSSFISIEMNGTQGNATDVAVMDMLGQAIKTQSGTAHAMQFNIADLPTGCYLVSCTQNGVKIATARFIKY